ncbi:MAG: hypothetical protein LBG42_05725 [Treponema sp.]|jgi:hypothetical protein|nr:hypothetical protein [Treponema sp.]
MSKAHRGKGIRELAARGRGKCPVCKRQNVKILYEQEAGEVKVKICKVCRAAVKHGRKSVIDTAVAGKSAVNESESVALPEAESSSVPDDAAAGAMKNVVAE